MGNIIIDLSWWVWSEGPEKTPVEQSVLLMQDFDHSAWSSETPGTYFVISFGENVIEDGFTGCVPTYLAICGQDGGYRLERAERYMEERDVEFLGRPLVLDLRKFPDQIDGIRLGKAERFCCSIPSRWRRGDFLLGDDGRGTWRLVEHKGESADV